MKCSSDLSFLSLPLTWNSTLNKTWRTSQFIFDQIQPSLRSTAETRDNRPNATTRDPKRSSICRRKLRKEISIALIKQFITACWMEETFPISTFFFSLSFPLPSWCDSQVHFTTSTKQKEEEVGGGGKSILQNVTSRRRRSFAEAVARSILIFCSLPVW